MRPHALGVLVAPLLLVLAACDSRPLPQEAGPAVQPSASPVVAAPSPPPAPYPELVPPPPAGVGPVVWQPGRWRYMGEVGGPWVWQRGQYVPPPRGQTTWIPGQWQQQPTGGWAWVEAHWA